MTRSASVRLALLLGCAASALGCADGGDESPTDGQPDAHMSVEAGASPSATQDASGAAPDADAQPSGSTDAGSSSATSDASSGGGSADATTPRDAATKPALDLEIPTASVPCNGKPCDTLANVCCESWSKGAGFGATQSCMTREMCNKTYSRSGETNRAIPHECDGKEDCSGGQVCCMIAYSQPLCELADISECITKITGPGGSGICADNDQCMLGSTQFVAEGVPLGILACNDDSDCADRPETRCQPEQSNSLTTGKGVQARSYVKVCR